jgi:hypothetical protein
MWSLIRLSVRTNSSLSRAPLRFEVGQPTFSHEFAYRDLRGERVLTVVEQMQALPQLAFGLCLRRESAHPSLTPLACDAVAVELDDERPQPPALSDMVPHEVPLFANWQLLAGSGCGAASPIAARRSCTSAARSGRLRSEYDPGCDTGERRRRRARRRDANGPADVHDTDFAGGEFVQIP